MEVPLLSVSLKPTVIELKSFVIKVGGLVTKGIPPRTNVEILLKLLYPEKFLLFLYIDNHLLQLDLNDCITMYSKIMLIIKTNLIQFDQLTSNKFRKIMGVLLHHL